MGVFTPYFVEMKIKKQASKISELSTKGSTSLLEVIGGFTKRDWYHGQIAYGGKLPSIRPGWAKKEDLPRGLADILRERGLEGVYDHQNWILSKLPETHSLGDRGFPPIQGASVMSGPPGSGRTTTVALAACLEARCSGLTTLVILLDEDPEIAAARRESVMNDIRPKSADALAVRAVEVADYDSLKKLSSSDPSVFLRDPDVVVTTLANLHGLVLPHAKDLAKDVIQSLGLIVLVSTSRMSVHRTAHAKFVVQRLLNHIWRCGNRIRALVIADQLQNSAQYAANLLGVNEKVIHAQPRDAAPVPPVEFCFWVPPLIRRSEVAPEPAVTRVSMLDEARTLVAGLAKHGQRTLAIGNHVRLGMTGNEKTAILNLAAAKGIREIESDRVVVKRGIRYVRGEDFGKFDAVVCYGITEDWGALSVSLRRLVRSGGGVCVVTQTEPRGLEMARQAPRLVSSGRSSTSVRSAPDRKHIYGKRLHGRAFLGDIGKNELIDAEEIDLWQIEKKEASVTEEHAAEPNSFEKPIDVWRVTKPCEIDAEKADFERGNDSAIPLMLDGHRVSYFTQSKAWIWAREAAVVFVNGQRYVVGRVRDETIELTDAPPAAPLESIPQLRIDVENQKQPEFMAAGERSMVFEFGWVNSVEMDQTHLGFLQIPESRSTQDVTRLKAPIKNNKRKICGPAIALSGTSRKVKWSESMANGFAAVLSQLLPRVVWNSEDLILNVVPRPNVRSGYMLLIHNSDQATQQPLESLYAKIRSEQLSFLAPLYALVSSCPCTDGCEGCIRVAQWQDRVDKAQLTLWLGYLTGKAKEAEHLVERRSVAVGVSELEDLRSFYNMIVEHEKEDHKKVSIFHRLFLGQLDLDLKRKPRALAEIQFLDGATGGVLGVYIPKFNRIELKRKMPELQFIMVLGHEYAHNWQEQSGRWKPPKKISKYYGGLLLIEGFAEWVAYKLMGFYASNESMEIKDMRKYDEYGEGLDFLRYVEEQYGMAGVMGLATGNPPEKDTHLLLQKSGVYDRILENEKKNIKWSNIFGG
jgi:hypothetical protein